MLIKNAEYNSLWQTIGELKSKEPKTIPLPMRLRSSIKEAFRPSLPGQARLSLEPTYEFPPDPTPPPIIQTEEKIETQPVINTVANHLSGDHHQDNLSMAAIEDHQKRHTFAPSLHQAEQNYRELRRLVNKMNGSILKEQKTKRIS